MRKERHRNPKFAALHRAREMAAQFVYALELHPPARDPEEALEIFTAEDMTDDDSPELSSEPVPALTEEAGEYLRFLALGAWNARYEADEIMLRIEKNGWTPDRMSAVDRAILRVAIFEGFIQKERDVPFSLAIAEAVKTARDFGADKSVSFVNGVLASVARAVLPPEAIQEYEAAKKQKQRKGTPRRD